MPILSLNSISKSYNNQSIIDNISLNVEEGEIFGLIGLNGVGKTTLIKTILQLVNADTGNITIANIPADNVASRQNLLYLPEKFQPSKYLTGYEYLALTLEYYGKNLDLIEARKHAEQFDLNTSKLSEKISSYSKGMSQKIGLIGAFLCNSPLLILDEPMSGLDPLARAYLKKELIMHRSKGRSVFFSSHILSDIDEICDRIGVIHNGSLVFEGTPDALKTAHPSHSLEQSFLHAISQD